MYKRQTEGAEVEKWANGFENYTFEENNGSTTVTVDLDTNEEFIDYMNQTYPKAVSYTHLTLPTSDLV